MKPTVYIAGPMTGYEDYNYPAFDEAASEWADRGWAVLNPADHFLRDQDLDMSQYMRGAIHALLQADAVALLPGWTNSPGATMEVIMAHRLGLTVYDVAGFDMTDKIRDVRYSDLVPNYSRPRAYAHA